MPYAHTDDCAIYYEVRGDAGTPLLLIAGYGSSIANWPAEFVDAVAARHRVVLFDNRGAGNSGKPRRPYTMNDFVDDAAAVLDAVGVGAAHVMGLSLGGAIAQNFALRHPERVRGLILGCTLPGGLHSDVVTLPEQAMLDTLLAPRTDDREQDIRNMWPILYSEDYIAERRELLEELARERAAAPPTPHYALECQMHALAETHDVFERLCDIDRPTLVLAGSSDVLIPPQNSQVIAEHIPGSRLIEYEGAGHGFLDEAGQRAVDDVLVFLAEVNESQN